MLYHTHFGHFGHKKKEVNPYKPIIQKQIKLQIPIKTY